MTDADISNISSRLLRQELRRLALHLGVPSDEVTSSLNDNTKLADATNHVLTVWLHAQNDREAAYSEMGNALVEVNLNLIAREVLDFNPKQK